MAVVAVAIAVASAVIVAAGPAPAAWSADAAAGTTVRVAIKPLDPFVVRDGADYQGFSIDLWAEVARRNGWSTEYAWYDTLPPLLDDVAAARLDAGIAGISITRERESRIDFSYPMFNAGLQVMTGRVGEPSWTDQLGGLFSASVGKYLVVLLVALLLAGNVLWLVERRRHEGERHGYVRGIGHGTYRAAAVALAGDLGSSEARKPAGRLASMVWVVAGIVFVSLFTATVTTRLTVQSIKSGIGGVDDLAGHRVVTVEGSTAARALDRRAVAYTPVRTIDDAYALLDRGEAEAIVFDAPVLQHRAQVAGSRRYTIVGSVFQREDYGIALPTGSALRKPINEALLAMRADGSFDALYQRYFGSIDR